MKFADIYKPTLELKNAGMLSGQWTKEVVPGDDNLPWDTPLIQAFMDDNDLQQIQIVSTNIGFVKTLTKQFKRAGSTPALGNENEAR